MTARAERSDLDSKLVVVQGDIENQCDLGIDDAVKARLLDDVSVVFHLAATVSFNEPLRYCYYYYYYYCYTMSRKQGRHYFPACNFTRYCGFSSFFQLQTQQWICNKVVFNEPPHLTRVDTLPCEILMSENLQQSEMDTVVNNKSQGSVATHLRCGGIFNY